jgi:hypothetical protein
MTEDRETFVLVNSKVRDNAVAAVNEAPPGWRVTVAPPLRSGDQNSKMWAMLADVARAKPEGRNWTPETWKAAFMHSLGHQVLFAEGLDGSGPFPIGFRTSKLNVKQMIDLITVIYKYGDEHEVDWKEARKGGYLDFLERVA